jgi:hypothetical protein
VSAAEQSGRKDRETEVFPHAKPSGTRSEQWPDAKRHLAFTELQKMKFLQAACKEIVSRSKKMKSYRL